MILIKIHAKAEPNMNVPRIFTGMNHLNDNNPKNESSKAVNQNELEETKLTNPPI